MSEHVVIDEELRKLFKPGVFEFYEKFVKLYNVAGANERLVNDTLTNVDLTSHKGVIDAITSLNAKKVAGFDEFKQLTREAVDSLIVIPKLDHCAILLEISDALADRVFHKLEEVGAPSNAAMLRVYFVQANIWDLYSGENLKFCIINHPPGEKCESENT